MDVVRVLDDPALPINRAYLDPSARLSPLMGSFFPFSFTQLMQREFGMGSGARVVVGNGRTRSLDAETITSC